MGFGNFIKGIVAQVNPFDNGRTYGSYNPPRKRRDDQNQFGSGGSLAPQSAPNQNNQQSQQPQQPKPQRPENIFAGLHNNLALPGAPKNQLDPNHTVLTAYNTPQPGTVIAPNHHGGGLPSIGHALHAAGDMFDNIVKPIAQIPVNAQIQASNLMLKATHAKPMSADQYSKRNLPLSHNVKPTGANATNKQMAGDLAVAGSFVAPGLAETPGASLGVKTLIDAGAGAAGFGGSAASEGKSNSEIARDSAIGGLFGMGTRLGFHGAGSILNKFRTGDTVKRIGIDKPVVNALTNANDTDLIHSTLQKIYGDQPGLRDIAGKVADANSSHEVVKAIENLPIESLTSAGATAFASDAIAKARYGESPLTGKSANKPAPYVAPPDAPAAPTSTRIPVTQAHTIEVATPSVESAPIPVRNATPKGKPIVEIGGDRPNTVRIPTSDEAAAQKAANRFDAQAPSRPDQRIEGVSTRPEDVFTTAKRNEFQTVLDNRLQSNQITAEEHQALTDELSKTPVADQPVPAGRKIEVKSVNPVSVQGTTDVPVGLPETPGQVRATTQSAPNNAATEAVANAPVAAAPAPLPKEVQAVLDNPKQFNKRQVAAARNQAKLAKKFAKTQEDTAAAMERINSASPNPSSSEGFVDTGKFDTSANGGAYQTASRKAEMDQAIHETSQMSPGDAIKTARENQATNGGFNPRDVRNIRAMFETKRIVRGTPEWQQARQILKDDGTLTAQALALRGGATIRRTASSSELMNQYESKIYRLAEDPSKIDSKMFDDVEAATNNFTEARDAATQAHNTFTEAPTSANAKAYHAAQDAADQADKDAKMTEFKVAQKVLKGNKDAKQVRELQKMAQESDLYQMDAIDSSMLSGTGTFARNFVNSAVGGVEEALGGGIGSRIAKAITGENVGGGFGRGTLSGFNKGTKNIVDASKARASEAGWNPLSHVKNWATTGNQLGDTVIESQVTHNVIDHYTQALKSEGYKGRELADRASVMARQDPDQVGRVYAGYARAAAGLGSGIAKGGKIETIVKNAISDSLSLGNPNQASEMAAKLITRMTVGFPSAVGRTIVEGGKRATLGVPNALKLFGKAAREDPAVRAQIIKESIKQAGTGATAGAIFYALGQHGAVTGSYPTDPEERARWQREGITENSIKIGDNYYQLPSYLGSAAIPAMFAATLGRNNGDIAKSAAEVAKGLPAILPTDQASNWLDALNGRTDPLKFATQTAASATRALTPAGALLNQIAKSFDSTANDTTTGTALENFVDKVASGIPGVNNAANIPSKTDDAGNVIHNPSALPLAFGASSTVQGQGVEHSADMAAQVDSKVKSLQDVGVMNDPNLKGVLDGKTLKTYNDINSGKKVSDSDLKKMQDALVKGVSTTGEDTAYLEREQYDTNIAALKLKRQMMSADKTVKPSEIKKLDTAITRGQVYKENTIPYDMIKAYESTSLTDWRSMGDSESDSYDPQTYQDLWKIDELMTGAGVSYNKGDLNKNKFSAKKPGKGRAKGKGSRGGVPNYSTDFGTLKAGTGAPNVKQYQSIDQQSGNIPTIQVVRPNIVHKISASG